MYGAGCMLSANRFSASSSTIASALGSVMFLHHELGRMVGISRLVSPIPLKLRSDLYASLSPCWSIHYPVPGIDEVRLVQ